MKYGVCTWIFGNEPLPKTAARLAGLGYDGVELKGDLELYDPTEVKAILDDHGLVVLSLTPEDVDLPHPDAEVRAKAVDYYLRLLDFAVGVGAPMVGCHGAVGRIRSVTTYEQEYVNYVVGIQRIAERAQELGLRLAIEVLNRYESHLLNTSEEAVRFVEEVGAPNVGILLDAYHMNIEEADLGSAIRAAGAHLFLFHAADSNRQAVGRGHTDFIALTRALKAIGYQGDVVFECVPPGPDPFTANKGPDSLSTLETYLRESLALMKTYWQVASDT